jgi:alanine dehydrogenase
MLETMVRVLTGDDHHELLSFEEAYRAVRSGFGDQITHSDAPINNDRTRIFNPETGVRLTTHTGAAIQQRGIGSVLHTEIPHSDAESQSYGEKGEPSFVLYDGESAQLKGLIVGDIRLQGFPPEGLRGCQTAIGTAVGIDELTPDDVSCVGLFGSGSQAKHHLMVLEELRDIESVAVYSPTVGNRKAFAERMEEFISGTMTPVEGPTEVVSGADVVMCATNASTPVFDGSLLEPGQTVISIVAGGKGLLEVGNAASRRREIDDTTVSRADVYVTNSVELAREDEQGDFYFPIRNGVLEWDDVVELRDVLSGEHPGRESAEEIVVYKQNSRQGITQTALMARLFEAAVEAGVGTEV